ncbi:MAG: RES family NAD+ phosphorylase [Novosphingobium sp.]
MIEVPLRTVSGRFWRAIAEDRVGQVLDPPGRANAGRYHRPGQAALYITPEADWATIAIGRYLLADGVKRAVVPLELDRALVFDQRDPAACQALGIDPELSQVRWNDELAAGREPPSWAASDAARQAGAQGIIDQSRGIAGGWHVCLFRWNQPGSPQVRVAGPAQDCDYWPARERWAAPDGWALPDHLARR